MPSTSFFGTKIRVSTPAHTITKPKKVLVDMGGLGDSGFRSAAAAILDNIVLKKRTNQKLAEKVRELHANYFDQQPMPARLLTPSEHVAKLIETPVARARFISELAYALRQETVTEMGRDCENINYRKAFMGTEEESSPAQMRKQGAYIHETAVATAIAKISGVEIKIQHVEPERGLFSPENYNSQQKQYPGSSIIMQLQARHYMPKLSNPDYFASMSKPVPINPKNSAVKDPTLAEIRARIESADRQKVEDFHQNVKRLRAMLDAGEMTPEKLEAIHIQGMNESNLVEGFARNGTQQIFEEIKLAIEGVRIVEVPTTSHAQQVTEKLLEAVARGICFGQLDANLVYEAEERQAQRYS